MSENFRENIPEVFLRYNPAMRVLDRKIVDDNFTLELVHGDLTDEKVDAIVNAANRWLKHGGGVAGAILRKGGPLIQRESDAWITRRGPLEPDRPAWTHAGNLPCRYIIHVAGPIWGEGDEDDKLIRAIRGALVMAGKLRIKTMAMPAVSTGIFGFPKERAAPLIYNTIIENWATNPTTTLCKVRVTIIDDVISTIFFEAFKIYFHQDG